MAPTHETFWNIPTDGLILYPLAAVAVGILVYALLRRIRLWRMGKGKTELGGWGKRVLSFIGIGVTDGLFHRRFLRDPYPGLMHLLIFWGCIILLIGTFLDVLSHYGLHFMKGGFYLVSSLVLDIFGILILVGVAVAAYRRYVQRPGRLDNQPGDGLALILIALVVITGYLVEGFRLSVPEPGDAGYAVWSPVGAVLAGAFDGLGEDSRLAWHQGLWWTHSLLVLSAIAYLSLSNNKLSHVIVSTVNAFLRPLGPKSVLQPIDIEKAETMGVGKLEEFRWKDLLDLESCTRCGRCQDNCPTHLSDKALSPKKVIQDLKAHWLEQAARPASEGEEQAGPSMVGEVIPEQAIWDCTSCRSCEEQCPVYIQPLHKIMEMRRYLALMLGKLPETAQITLRNMQQRGHPWAGSQYLRLRDDWLKEVGISKLASGQQSETLLWVGCTGALAERNVKVTAAVVKLLRQAGVEFGVLGGDETCCGDPARRLGYELQFQEMAQRNIQMFQDHGVKRIITFCPHCYNVLKNEYTQFGGSFQ
ncbi:MAG: heterodisulfide reductase-related iron-sulfur binding cluster, partial [Chloroflexota bacterium]